MRGKVKDIFLPPPDVESDSVTSSPRSLCEALGFGFLPFVLAQVLRGSTLAISLLSSDDAESICEAGKPGGCLVGNT
jgi:hypothetical protein